MAEKQRQPQPFASRLGTTGGVAPELLVLLGQVGLGSQLSTRFVQRSFF
jgi:hypothetical protein